MKSPWDNENNNIFSKVSNSNFLNKGNAPINKGIALLFAIGIALIWVLSGIYQVKEGEQAIVLRFGKFVRVATAGLNYRLPAPIENAIIESTQKSRRIEIGYKSGVAQDGGFVIGDSNVSAESIMLTGDENIVYLNCDVTWHIKDLQAFLFSVANPQEAVKTVTESVIREIIGQTSIAAVLSTQKQEITDKIELLAQKILDQYNSGVHIEKVQLLKAEPPGEVIDAYRDVQTSRADKEREINQAQAYYNDVLPRARGEAAKILKEAEAFQQEIISIAQGDASRFEAALSSYRENPIMKSRIYLEVMEAILKNAKKTIIGSSVIPYMSVKNQFIEKGPINKQEAQ